MQTGLGPDRDGVKAGMRFRILGPLEVWDGDQLLPIRAPKQRALLAMLLLRANTVAPVEWLIDQLWGPAPPPTARVTLQNHVRRLRQALQPDSRLRAAAPLLVTRPPGYLLVVEPAALDLHRFQQLVAAAQQALQAGNPADAAVGLRDALALWRGPPLADIDTAELRQVQALRLEELRLAALEAYVQADLQLGRHSELIGELRMLVAEQPLRERLHGQLMLALYRSGRRADALAAYRELRGRLVEELGVEPGRALQQLERQLLAGDAALDPPAAPAGIIQATAPPVPRQLPPDIAGFTGRMQQLAALDRMLAGAWQGGPVVISAVAGAGGIGKSALAIHAAHHLTDAFPDGQLYVNLQGATAGLAPLLPLEVLGRFLRALGVDGNQVPTGVGEAAARFRSEVASRRLLVVLDNARDAAQVAPLLPGAPGCGVLVTSRRVLSGLDGACHLHLDVLPVGEAVALLGRLVGQARIAAEAEAAAEVAGWCGCLPLALRIAGARLAARPTWPVRALVARLADATRRLDELELAEVGVRASLAVSYQQLKDSADPTDRAAAAAFGLLGVLDGPELGVPVAARLLDRSEREAERVLERLVDAHVLEAPAAGRYRMHDLLRLYAREQAAQAYPAPERAAALNRAFGLYAATAWHTLALLRPGDHRLDRIDDRWRRGGIEFPDAPAALAWLEAERANLLAVAQQAATTPGLPQVVAVQLAHALFGFFQVRGYWQDWVRLNQAALRVARQMADRAAQAQAHSDLGLAHQMQGRYEQALACQQQSLAIRRELDDRRGQAASLGNLGLVYEWQGRYEQALACQQESLAIYRELDDRRGQSTSLSNLGTVHKEQGRYEQALACHEESLAIDRELDDHRGQAANLGNLGVTHERLGHYDQALARVHEALAIFGELGDRQGEAESLRYLGGIHERQERYDQALACLRQSMVICQELGNPHGQAESLRELGVTLRALGRHEQARAHWQQALAIFERLQTTAADEVRALLTDHR